MELRLLEFVSFSDSSSAASGATAAAEALAAPWSFMHKLAAVADGSYLHADPTRRCVRSMVMPSVAVGCAISALSCC